MNPDLLKEVQNYGFETQNKNWDVSIMITLKNDLINKINENKNNPQAQELLRKDFNILKQVNQEYKFYKDKITGPSTNSRVHNIMSRMHFSHNLNSELDSLKRELVPYKTVDCCGMKIEQRYKDWMLKIHNKVMEIYKKEHKWRVFEAQESINPLKSGNNVYIDDSIIPGADTIILTNKLLWKIFKNESTESINKYTVQYVKFLNQNKDK